MLKKMYIPDQPEFIIVVHDGVKHTMPLESFEEAVDRISLLAWKSASYKENSSFDWIDGKVELFPTDMSGLPIAETAEEVFRHLQRYGLLEGYGTGSLSPLPPKCEEISLTPAEMKSSQWLAKTEHVPLFRWLWRRHGHGHGGRRSNAGRKKETGPISARVGLDVLNEIRLRAEEDGISISAKTAEILTDWSNKKKSES